MPPASPQFGVEFRDNWDASRQRFCAFWQGEIVDRCCIAVRAPRQGAAPAPASAPPATQEDLVRDWVERHTAGDRVNLDTGDFVIAKEFHPA